MKKIFSAIAATLLISALSACTAADDTTISSPRSTGAPAPDNGDSNKTGISELCSDYTVEQSLGDVTLYFCEDDDKYYGCEGARCQVIDDYEEL
jgi:hypothetical protein